MPSLYPSAGAPLPTPRPLAPFRWLGLVGGAVLAIGALAAYRHSFSAPLLLDDEASIAGNPTIRHLWPIGTALSPPAGGITVSGRPLLNLSLALNYAAGGLSVWGYHAVNLAIHILAGLTLWGIVRRTFPSRALIAWAIALIWTLHPLQTESVTYLIQRAESLMGLFYLLTLYSFIRYAEEPGKWREVWAAFSVLACLCGMATKEVMVSAPIVVLLYDRTFLAGSFGEAWRRRRMVYLGLASTWILLACLVLSGGGNRNGSIGFGLGVSWWAYGLTQFQAIAHYLRLVLWPHPLIFEYGTFQIQSAGQIVPYAAVIVPLIAATVVALWRWPVGGFLGFWFFAILAPTSLVSGATQTIAEHRMYLALAPVLIAAGIGGAALVEWRLGAARGAAVTSVILILIAGICGLGTLRRNHDYRSALALWSDTVAHRPGNALAHNNLGRALDLAGRKAEAIAQYEEALRLKPDFAEAHNNVGLARLAQPGRLDAAIAQFAEAVRLQPNFAEAHNNLGLAWSAAPGRIAAAIAEYQETIRIRPDFAAAHDNLGLAWSTQPGRAKEAIAEFETAVRLEPDFAEAHNNLGLAWSTQPGGEAEAIAQYREALRLKPQFFEAHLNLGLAWSKQPGRAGDAITQYQEALRLRPDSAAAHGNLGAVYSQLGRWPAAIEEDEAAVKLRPAAAKGHLDLGLALAAAGRKSAALAEYDAAHRLDPRLAEAAFYRGVALVEAQRLAEGIASYEQALAVRPDYDVAQNNLAVALCESGRLREAVPHYRRAIQLNPAYLEAHFNFGICLEGLRQFGSAAAEFAAAVQLRPNLAAAELEWGRCLQAQGLGEESARHLRRAAQLQARAAP
jgi:tetratricopeptide (TPR) repeat protein